MVAKLAIPISIGLLLEIFMPEQLTGYPRSGQLPGGVREEREQCFQAVDILLLPFVAIGKIRQLGSTGWFNVSARTTAYCP